MQTFCGQAVEQDYQHFLYIIMNLVISSLCFFGCFVLVFVCLLACFFKKIKIEFGNKFGLKNDILVGVFVKALLPLTKKGTPTTADVALVLAGCRAQ